jgi:hypothetical protein
VMWLWKSELYWYFLNFGGQALYWETWLWKG